MSDSFHRRQPPSPLVFQPEGVQPSVSSQSQTSRTSSHGSGSNTVSMPFVRRHVTRRLKTAKAECDKELQRVTNSITAFFEERLREGDYEREAEREYRERERERGRGRESLYADPDALRDAFALQAGDSKSALQTDEISSEGGYEAELESNHHSRQPSNSAQSPGTLRRLSTLPWGGTSNNTTATSTTSSSPNVAAVPLPESTSPRRQAVGTGPGSTWQGISRRLSRSIHIPQRLSRSSASSRSTSRSRSPLPPTTRGSFSDNLSATTSNRRSSRILVDDPVDPIMTALYAIIGVATDVTEMSLAQLTSQPKVCEQIVQRVQDIGKAWDEHPDWHGRNWYVQVLLAVASLSRVVEWWEAEKQFWNFDDNEDEQQDEPLTFVMKPPEAPVAASAVSPNEVESEHGRRPTYLDDENRLRLARPDKEVRRSRDEVPKDLSPITLHPDQHVHPRITPKMEQTESARVLATERLRLQAETAQNQNIVMELALDGDHFIWVNYAWRVVVGNDPEDLTGTRISRLLIPSDWGVFRDATRRLQDDDSHTITVAFKLRIESDEGRETHSGTLYQQMEGQGMLMIDREDGQPSHTMWVVKPVGPPRYEQASPSIMLEPTDAIRNEALTQEEVLAPTPSPSAEPATPFPFHQPISTEPILCRICECQIPQWYFEKHSETCVETHRLEAEIQECNESISELRNTIRDISQAIDRSVSATPPEYRGMPIFSPSGSPGSSSPLNLFRSNKMQRLNVKKMQRLLLEQLDEILQVACEVSMPALMEDESKEPIERQRLLSPTSERKMSQIRNWTRPQIDDPALDQLCEDSERVMRQKIDNVARLQNTIRYAEKIWLEWKERVEEHLAALDASDAFDEEGVTDVEEDQDGDHSSTTSEYAFGGETPSPDPTPVAAPSPTPVSIPSENRPPSTVSVVPTAPTPVLWQPGQPLYTRSSTPSSISSPLALAAPIVAPMTQETPPPMTLDEFQPPHTIRARRSASNLPEPRFMVTPPLSPMLSPRDTVMSRRGHRRHSTINPILSPVSGPTTPATGPSSGPLSPRQPSSAPLSRTSPTTIKDFEIIKPISKGAFGSVFLAKKRVTGDYYAIKVLKKADMIAKNQITNVKAERMILMNQAESPFVAKLYFTFQSKENLYLVMEYLNGGDCAALIKSLGSLPEEWTKNYVAEVVLGLEYLHQRGIVHRDLKPDNLLIDQHGHLKLTDFGLSRIGLLGRQTREGQVVLRHNSTRSRSRPPSMDAAYLSSPMIAADLTSGGSYFSQRTQSVPRPGSSPYLPSTDDVSESSGSESLSGFFPRKSGGRPSESPLQSFASELTTDLRSHPTPGSGTPPMEQKFVGTPDYLAPETILGLRGDDAAVDWWALGVITYEFLYGIPPFHAETPEKVFENILSGHTEWHEDWVEFSPEARDFMERLMTLDPTKRLGVNGADEVKNHPFFMGIDWDKVTSTEAAFIPQVTDPESTDYFDPRGAIPQLFQDEEMIALPGQSGLDSPVAGPSSTAYTAAPAQLMATQQSRELGGASPGSDDFGSFSFKNLPVLKQANDDVIRKIKTDQLAPMTHTLSDPTSLHGRRKSISHRIKKPPSVITSVDQKPSITNPPSPATSTSSIASSPSRANVVPPAPGSTGIGVAGHTRKPSEFGALERFKLNHMDLDRRNSMPSRLRTASVSSVGDGSGSDTNWPPSVGHSGQFEASTPPSSVHSIDLKKGPDPNDRAVTCLLAEDNPITAKIIETLLIRLGCRCVVVADGSEAISVAMGDIKFDCILMDLQMPVLDGESAARYIKSTTGKNASTPIIAVTAYSGVDAQDTSSVFAAFLAKPLQKADLLAVMRQLGFKTSTLQGGPGATKLTARRVVS